MGVTEFFTADADVWGLSDGKMELMSEGSPLVGEILCVVADLFPDADKALRECYSRSHANIPYYNYLRARRFCKCNFGPLDRTRNDVDGGSFHFERVPCPLRGECPHEGVICQPRMETRLSAAEERVMRLVCDGRSNAEIASELYLSPNTVKRHVSSAYTKVGARNRADFVRYAEEKNLFGKNANLC